MNELVGNAVESLFSRRGLKRQSIRANLLRALFVKYILPVKRMDGLHEKLDSLPKTMAISDRVLRALDVGFELSPSDRARIPRSGPLIAVANHPFGAVEGLVLSSLLGTARGDARIMANFLLAALAIGELNEELFYVDPYRTRGATSQNIKPLLKAVDWVRSGHALGIFPAGEVSCVHDLRSGVIDSQWSPGVARIIRKTEASVLPVYFEGRNSLLFCALGLIHPLLRSMLLPRENLRNHPRMIRVYIGKPVSPKKLAGLGDLAMMEYLRLRTYNLKNRKGEKRLISFAPASAPALKRQPVAGAKAAGTVMGEIEGLPPQQRLVSTKNFEVFCLSAPQAPNTIHEIGRLREIAFRGAGEGTGRSLDIDRFDSYYRHIILWDRQGREIVGGYRLGPADAILEAYGVKGLYTNTLFEYQSELFTSIGLCLEVGRSFVRPEYQKTYQPLLLLWSGIGSFVAKNPRYRFLFGAVSISNDYLGISRRLIVRFLRAGYTRSDLARFVRPRQPIARRWPGGKKDLAPAYSTLCDINEFSEVISDIETDSKGIPILLKHYVKLGGQFLGFGVDPAFSKSIDALVLVDLARTDPHTLERYMGPSGLASFLQFHSVGDVPEAQKCG